MHDTDPDSSPRTSSWRRALTAVSLTIMLVLVGTAACTESIPPKESVESLRAKSSTLRDKKRLRIGVRETVPLMGYRDPNTNERSGFEIELARTMAAELGFTEDKIEWVSVSTVPDRIAALQNNRADMVLANLSMNEEREKLVDFAGPYMLVPQAVMVRRDRTKPLDTIADLRAPGVKVCTGTGSTSEKALIAKEIIPEPVDSNVQCMDGLKSKKYDAYSTDLPILAGFLAADKNTFEILELTIADFSERIGVAVPNGDWAMRDLVAHFLNRWQKGSEESSPWLHAYDSTIGQILDRMYRSQPLVENPPDLADHDSKAPR